MSRRLLMEGILDNPQGGDANCIFYPEAAYVVQPVFEGEGAARKQTGKRAYFFFGKDRRLDEAFDPKAVQIVESYDQLELVEKALPDGSKVKLPKDGAIFVEGPYQRSDVKNANGRTYSRKLWERLVGDSKSDVQRSITERRMIGHLEHPADGRTHGKEGALLNTSLKLREDGVVWGKSELLDTPNGLILQEYTRKGVRWGVSSRGSGSVDSEGRVNESDFSLVTFDAVMNPSTPGAFPSRSVTDDTSKSVGESKSLAGVETVRAFLEEDERLQKVDVSKLSENERLDYARKLATHFSQASSLGPDALELKRRNDLQDWLSKRLKESLESASASRPAQSAQPNDITEADSRSESVIAKLRARLMDEQEETEKERRKAEILEGRLAKIRQELEEKRHLLSEAYERNKDLRRQLSIAEALIAEKTEQSERKDVQEAIEEAVNELPELEEFRSVLEKAASPEEVSSLSERLVETIAERKQEQAASAHVSFTPPPFPAGLPVQSEANAHKPRKLNESAGARMAGVIISGKK